MERYPLQWPANQPRTPASERKRALFNKKVYNGSWNEHKQLSIEDAVKRVEFELDAYTPVKRTYRVDPNSIIISTNLPTNMKGIPRGNMGEPSDPGAAVYFNLDGRDYCLPCDKWNRVADNIAAIAAHIKSMRDIERYGVGQKHDVYTGFKALPPPAKWWQVLGVTPTADEATIKFAYRNKIKTAHPDHGGTVDEMERIQKAYKEALSNF